MGKFTVIIPRKGYEAQLAERLAKGARPLPEAVENEEQAISAGLVLLQEMIDAEEEWMTASDDDPFAFPIEDWTAAEGVELLGWELELNAWASPDQF